MVERQAVSAGQRNPPMGRPLHSRAQPGSKGQLCPIHPLPGGLAYLTPPSVSSSLSWQAGPWLYCRVCVHAAEPRQE